MQRQRLEAQVLDIVDQVVAGKRVEDDRVELKRDWPSGDLRKTARRIAGHANAAGGEPILWIIGLDEKTHRVHEPNDEIDSADWWNQIASKFSERVAPDPEFLRVPTPHGPVVALRMDTSRTPYLVTTDGHGGVEAEVPWRSGTAVRSAKRSEILRSVIREAEVPQMDLIAGWVRAVRVAAIQGNDARQVAQRPIGVEVGYSMQAYVEAREPVRLPLHRWALALTVGEHQWPLPDPDITGPQRWIPGQGGSSGFFGAGGGGGRWDPIGSIAYVLNSGLHVNGSDTITISGSLRLDDPAGDLDRAFRKARRVVVSARFPIALSTREAAFDAPLRRSRLSPMDWWIASEDVRLVDERLGEFTFGGDSPTVYQGREERMPTTTTDT